MRPGLRHDKSGSLESVPVAMEEVPEVLHPREEPPQFVPLAPSDLLCQDLSPDGQDPDDFGGLEFLMAVQHDVETGIAARKLQAATSDNGDSVGS
jgi:hypothetical protein